MEIFLYSVNIRMNQEQAFVIRKTTKFSQYNVPALRGQELSERPPVV
jgi:hypothetical protein